MDGWKHPFGGLKFRQTLLQTCDGVAIFLDGFVSRRVDNPLDKCVGMRGDLLPVFVGDEVDADLKRLARLGVETWIGQAAFEIGVVPVGPDVPIVAGSAAHLARRDDALVSVAPVLARVPCFGDLPLAEQMALVGFETKSANDRPLGLPAFVAMVEERLGRNLTPGQSGRKRKDAPPRPRPVSAGGGIAGRNRCDWYYVSVK